MFSTPHSSEAAGVRARQKSFPFCFFFFSLQPLRFTCCLWHFCHRIYELESAKRKKHFRLTVHYQILRNNNLEKNALGGRSGRISTIKVKKNLPFCFFPHFSQRGNFSLSLKSWKVLIGMLKWSLFSLPLSGCLARRELWDGRGREPAPFDTLQPLHAAL